MNKKIGIVITDGVGYRNFLMSDFLEIASKKFESVCIYSGLPKSCYNENLVPSNVDIVDLSQYKETTLVWFYRKLKEVSHMYLHRKQYGINDNLVRGYPKTNSKRSLVIKLIYFIASMFHSESFINSIEKKQFKAFEKDDVTLEYGSILKRTAPDLLFFTHQRPPYLSPMLGAAKKMNIKAVSFIFSWDNLASKGRMLGEFEGYLVWSDLMKKELLDFYPKTNPTKVEKVGTPQFEPYVLDRYKIDRVDFFTKFNLDQNKKIICYSCADADIGRNDEIHIRAIVKYITENNMQLLVRTSPAEDGKRFVKLMDEFPDIKWNFPKWIQARQKHAEAWSQRLPSVEDVIDLKSILSFSDVNVNMCSTMSLDFMLFDKPVINTVFGNKENNFYDDQKFLDYVHYEYVLKSNAVGIAKNEEELSKHLDEALNEPLSRKQQREALIDLEIGAPLEGTSLRIVEALKRM
jgi:hypothetical protein